MRFITELKIKLSSKLVGTDEFGNQYFENKKGRRFIIYKGIAEPTKIPAEWHGWIHFTSNTIPTSSKTNRYHWQKIHLPNLTGTKNSYAPKGNLLQNSNREKVSADYQAWNPEEQNQD